MSDAQAPETEAIRIGYWRSELLPTAPGLPDPRTLVDPNWPLRERVRVAKYLRQGKLVVAYMGYSHCRFNCGIPPRLMGTTDRGDDRYIWPEGLPHYVEVHAVRLPDEFLEHIAPRLPRLWPTWRLGVWWRAFRVMRARVAARAAELANAARSEREALHAAAESGNVDAVRRLLAEGRDVNLRDEYGLTALARARSFAVAQLLMDAGATLDPQPPGYITPLQQAVVANDREWCEAMLARGANIHALDKFDRSVLSYCDPSMLRFLLDAGADVQLGDPVCNAVQHADLDMINELLDRGAAIEGTSKMPPLLIAARNLDGDAALALLLARGADPRRVDDVGHSALHHAAARNSPTAVRLLLEHGAERAAIDPARVKGGRVSPLHMSAIGNKDQARAPEVLTMLLEVPSLRALIDARDEWGRTALCCAATYAGAEQVRVLLQAGADPTIANNDGHTPLAIAQARALADMQALLR